MAALVRTAIETAVGTAFSPFLSGSLLGLLYFGPEQIRQGIQLKLAMTYGQKKAERYIAILKAVFALGVVSRLNKRLNKIALNNWTIKSQKDKWVWNWEIAVITGGSSGIGLEVVKNLLKKGVKVAVLDVQPLPASLAGEKNVKYIKCDVSNPKSIHEAATQVRQIFGEPTILINNAGIGAPAPILDKTDEYIQKIFAINIMSHFTLTREFLPHMIKKNKGHIVGIASMASYVAPPGLADYGATKAGVMAFHEALNQEIKAVYKTPGVLNTVVHPYWVRTPLVAGYEAHLEKTQGRLMSPVSLAKKITDQIFSCSGGQLIVPAHMKNAGLLRAFPNWLAELARDISVGGSAADFAAVVRK